MAAPSPRCSSMTSQLPSRWIARPLSVGTITDPSRVVVTAPQKMLDAMSGFSHTIRAAPGGLRYSLLGLRVQTEPSGVVAMASQASSGKPSAGPKIATRPWSSTHKFRPQPNQSCEPFRAIPRMAVPASSGPNG
jgi:hypothetical protein